MIGMSYYYADESAQSPSDEENARAIRELIDDGMPNTQMISFGPTIVSPHTPTERVHLPSGKNTVEILHMRQVQCLTGIALKKADADLIQPAT